MYIWVYCATGLVRAVWGCIPVMNLRATRVNRLLMNVRPTEGGMRIGKSGREEQRSGAESTNRKCLHRVLLSTHF
jgi:hypothetical protein